MLTLTAVANVHLEAARLPTQTSHPRLLDQHMELRRLLALGVVQALRVLDDRSATSATLRAFIKQIDGLFTQHVAEEEALILPVLELHALCAWPVDGGDIELAARFDRLARDLLRDIARQERAFLWADQRRQGPG